MYSLTYRLLFYYTSLLIQKVLNIQIYSTVPSATRRIKMLTNRSRELQLRSGDENSHITIGSENWTYRSNGPQQTNRGGNYPTLIWSVSIHRIRPSNVLRDINNNANELVKAQTVNVRKGSQTVVRSSETLGQKMGKNENYPNVGQIDIRSSETLGPKVENSQKRSDTVAERQGNERAATEDSQLDTVHGCTDLLLTDTNMEKQALNCIPSKDPCQPRMCQNVNNVSTGRECNFKDTEGGHQMASNDVHDMVTGAFDSLTSVPELPAVRARPQPETRPQQSSNIETGAHLRPEPEDDVRFDN